MSQVPLEDKSPWIQKISNYTVGSYNFRQVIKVSELNNDENLINLFAFNSIINHFFDEARH
jgi:hypothetical protein